MNPPAPGKKWFALAIVAIGGIGALVAWYSLRDTGHSGVLEYESPLKEKPALPAAKPAFDFYLMALTVHTAYCADGHERQRECRLGSQRPLTIHGLWPERDEPRTYPHDCPGPPLDLDGALALELSDLMPGVADGLHEHEWTEHGRCSGLDDDEYFSEALRLARGVDAVLSAKLTTLAGRETSTDELRQVADVFHPGFGASLTFHCRTLRDAPAAHRREPYLVEVRQCVDNDGPLGGPGTPLDCGALKRRDTGCGKSFRITEVPGR